MEHPSAELGPAATQVGGVIVVMLCLLLIIIFVVVLPTDPVIPITGKFNFLLLNNANF